MMKNLNSIALAIIISFVLFPIISCTGERNRNPEAYAQLNLKIDSLLQDAVENEEIPGAVVYISVGGEAVYHRAMGWRDIESGVPLETSDIFRMASMTKGLTAVAVMQLVEKGLIHLDDEVFRFIPEFKNPQILIEVLPDSGFTSRDAQGEITIRQLLTHTSGIGYGFQDEKYNAMILKKDVSEGFEDDNRTSYENIQRLAELPLLFEPGERYVYGLSFDVLGVIIELVSGMRYDRYIEQEILDPLNMKDSYFIVPEEEQYRLVSVYQPMENGRGLVRTNYPDTAYPIMPDKQFFSGGSDLCSTAEDYARFLQMLLDGGEYAQSVILQQSSVDTMLSKQTPFDDGKYNQGFAAWIINETVAVEGSRGVGSFEFGGFYDTFSWTDPERDMAVVMLLQMYPGNKYAIHQKLQEVIFRCL